MLKQLLTFVTLAIACVLPSEAIIYHYDNFDTKKKECRLTGWGGTQPSSGKLTIPATYTHTDGIEYKVTRIAAGALNDLTTVTEINIPASVTVIGKSNSSVTDVFINNFYNCPKLKKFGVDADNTAFEVSAEGVLFLKGGLIVLRVPALVATDSEGRLKFDKTNTVISKDAFYGNTTVNILAISSYTSIYNNGGLNNAINLRKYEVKGNDGWLTKSGGLLINNNNRVVSWPPALETDVVRVPSGVDKILDCAFANTKVKEVKMSAVEEIHRNAFSNSAIETVALPGSVNYIMDGAFDGCASLKSISLESVDLKLPDRFARDCRSLERVTTLNPIYSLGESAFKGCQSLTDFPFSGFTRCDEDSIFYGCGFRNVIFDDEQANEDGIIGTNYLAACRNLERIDMSRISSTPDNLPAIGPDFASTCPNLKEFRFPTFAAFWKHYEAANPPAFGYACNLDKIVLHTFWNEEVNQFCYSTGSAGSLYTPKVYVAVTANSDIQPEGWNKWPIKDLFAAGNGAKVVPQIYCDPYTPGKDYVIPGATYYVPGGTVNKYSQAYWNDCQVLELFTVSFIKSGDLMKVVIGEGALSGAAAPRSFKVRFNDKETVTASLPGYAVSTTKMIDITNVRIIYTLDEVEMATDYPATHWTSASVIPITADPAPGEAIYYNLQGQRVANPEGQPIAIPGQRLYIRVLNGQATKIRF